MDVVGILVVRLSDSNLRKNGYYSLAQVADADSTIVWRQEWKSAEMIGLRGEEMEQWEGYLSKLRISLAWIKDKDDELLWSMNALGGVYTSKQGVYTSKLGCRTLGEGTVVEDLVRWWKQLWKYAYPLKARIFMWLALNNKELTWDSLQKK